MAFKYDVPLAQQTPTTDSKVVLTKSFKIDIAAGSGFTTATTYDLGWLPKEAQVVSYVAVVATAASGGGVTASTLNLSVGGQTIFGVLNMLSAGVVINGPLIGYMNNLSSVTTDQKVTYTPTNTTGNPTAGVIYVTLTYVV